MTDAVSVAKQVLMADGQPFATLSLAPGLSSVTADTPVPEARRNYMRLAGLIHPDKIKNVFDKATEAFQCLVRAFETFADPKARSAAAVKTAAGKQRGGMKAATKMAKTRPASRGAAAGDGKAPKPSQDAKEQISSLTPGRKGRSPKAKQDSEDAEHSSDEEESEEDDEVSSDEDDGFGPTDEEPPVSTSHKPIGQLRADAAHRETTIGCPHCRTRWEPDSKPQYSLFMGPWSKRVHCQLCLFVFGSATALHACPHCTSPFDYDASMYNDVVKCTRCKKDFGFAYYPVNQHLIDTVKLEAWKAERERERVKERETRLRARNGGKPQDEDADRLAVLVGTCIMEDRCPLCNARVKSKHRAHVVECAKTPQDERKGRSDSPKKRKTSPPTSRPPPKKGAKSAVDAVSTGETAAATKPATKSTPRAVKPKQAAPVKRAGRPTPNSAAKRKRSRRGDSSDDTESDGSEEEPAADSDSGEESLLSDTSEDDEDDDSSDDE